jgi:hypothetical protein
LRLLLSLNDKLEIDLELRPGIVVDRVVIVPLMKKLEIVSAFFSIAEKKKSALAPDL